MAATYPAEEDKLIQQIDLLSPYYPLVLNITKSYFAVLVQVVLSRPTCSEDKLGHHNLELEMS